MHRVPEDDYNSMKIILQILHHCIHKHEQTIDLVSLAGVIEHSHKYDCVDVVQPWTQTMLSSPQTGNPSIRAGLNSFITWHLESMEEMKRAFLQAVVNWDTKTRALWDRVNLLNRFPSAILGKNPAIHSFDAITNKT
jgi:hypothetical protein